MHRGKHAKPLVDWDLVGEWTVRALFIWGWMILLFVLWLNN